VNDYNKAKSLKTLASLRKMAIFISYKLTEQPFRRSKEQWPTFCCGPQTLLKTCRDFKVPREICCAENHFGGGFLQKRKCQLPPGDIFLFPTKRPLWPS